MTVDNMANLEIESFYETVQRYLDKCNDFTEKNIQVMGVVTDKNIKKIAKDKFENYNDFFEVQFCNEAPGEILKALCDVIHKFIIIVDTHDVKKLLTKDESNLFYGLKWIDNVLKHQKKNFRITDLVMTDFQCNLKDNESLGIDSCGKVKIPLNKLKFELSAIWVDAPQNIQFETKYENQVENYNKYLCERDVIDTVMSMVGIIRKLNL